MTNDQRHLVSAVIRTAHTIIASHLLPAQRKAPANDN